MEPLPFVHRRRFMFVVLIGEYLDDASHLRTGAFTVGRQTSGKIFADMDDAISDEDLMLRYRDGDAVAFDALYDRHRGGLYRFLLRQLRNAAIAEELFQEIWINLINARERYTVQAQFKTYLYRIARNRLVDHVRRQKGAVIVSMPGDADCPDDGIEVADDDIHTPDARAWASQQLEKIVELVEALPDGQRETFLLHQEGRLTLEGIAEVTGVNRETAKSRLRYALNKLRQGLAEYV